MKNFPSSFVVMTTAFLTVFATSASVLADSAKPVTVELKNAKGEKVADVELTSAENGVKVQLKASKLAPGKHGFHFHEKGSCIAPDFKSAGGHLNPDKKEHGLDNPKGSHAGDMPNIDVNRSGKVSTDFVAHGVTLTEGPNSLVRTDGVAIVIHAKADDQHSNPAGDSGDRIACGVISPAAESHAPASAN